MQGPASRRHLRSNFHRNATNELKILQRKLLYLVSIMLLSKGPATTHLDPSLADLCWLWSPSRYPREGLTRLLDDGEVTEQISSLVLLELFVVLYDVLVFVQ